MSHLILHIGTHKTGSTTIQDSLWRNAAKLKRNAVIYPRLDYQHTGHHGLIAESVGLMQAFRLKGGGQKTLHKLARHFEGQDVDLILSSEEFSRAEKNRSVDFDQIRQCFRSFDQFSVVCFLRPQWRLLQAIYLEISQSRSPPRPPALVQKALETGTCQGLYLDYSELLACLERTFGPDEILFVDFESVRQQKGGLIDAVLSRTRSGLSHLDLATAGNWHSNKSPFPVPQWMANLLAEPYPATALTRDATAAAISQSDASCCLTRAEIMALKDRFSDSTQNMIVRRRKTQPDFRLTDPRVLPGCIYREDVTIENWLRAGQHLARQSLIANTS